jgi:hypothetical protein
MTFETWLSDEDCMRLWAVVQGDLPESAATDDELVEFERCVTHAAMVKMAGADYLEHTVQ